jgi:hypothetical protein
LHKGGSLNEKAKVENVIVKADEFVSEHEYLFGKRKNDSKIIDVKSNQDFPDLVLGGGSADLGSILGK